MLQDLLNEYQSGVEIRDVQLLSVDPPAEVIDAFNDVQRARQDRDTLINEAEAFRNDIVPRARGEAAQLISEAEAYASEVVNRAKGDADRFNSIFESYKLNPEVTQSRIYLETMEKVFSKVIWGKIILRYIVPCMLGIFLVVLFQYCQTGIWFIYFEIQSTVWGRAFNYGPTFPLGYNTPFWNLNGSYFSFWIGATISTFGLKLLVDWFRKKEILTQIKNYELFSVIFICMVLMSILFFNATWMWNPETETSSTHFTGINRYIHPTVFILILLIYFFRTRKFTAIQYFSLFVFFS